MTLNLKARRNALLGGASSGAKPLPALRGILAFAVVLGLAMAFASEGRTQPLPSTQAGIEAAMKAQSAAGGGTVVVAPGVVEVEELRIPSNVILAGSGTSDNLLTTLRLKPGTDGRAVMVGFDTTGNGIENIIVDGNRKNQSPDRYISSGGQMVPVARPAALTFACNSCSANHVRIINAMYDGVQVSAATNVTISNSVASVAGRYGFFTTSTVNGVHILSSTAEDTGVAWRYLGGGAGFAAGGKNVEFRGVLTRRTNGDGVAAYASDNQDIHVLDSVFRAPKNHCVHLGGDRAVIARNKCYSPRLVGYFIANNWRPGHEAERNAVGGRILSNTVENAGTDGIKVQWYIADTQVKSNTVTTTFNHNIGIYDSRGVVVAQNIGRWPGTGRSPGPNWCHLKISNSQVVQSKNNFNYTGRTRPAVC